MWKEEKLDGMLSAPSEALVEDIRSLPGDLMILGAGGKIGPNLAVMAMEAVRRAGGNKRVIAVSRFSERPAAELLERHGIETIPLDLMAEGALDRLPDVENLLFLAGRKFGTAGREYLTWETNATLPALVARRFKGANIVAFSTGNVYPLTPVFSGGADETVPPSPVGEYAMSSLARERAFEAATREFGSRALLLRLNYAVDLRYGVLYDLAQRILEGRPVSVRQPCFNCVWQGYVNEVTLRALTKTSATAELLNITGPETVSTRWAAQMLGKYLGREPVFEGEEADCALLSNASKCFEWFGYPSVGLSEMLRWQAEWLLEGGRTLDKPTHFEERKGNY